MDRADIYMLHMDFVASPAQELKGQSKSGHIGISLHHTTVYESFILNAIGFLNEGVFPFCKAPVGIFAHV